MEKTHRICMSQALKDKAVYVCGDIADLSNAGYVFHQYSVRVNGQCSPLSDSPLITAGRERKMERKKEKIMHSHTKCVLASEVNLRNTGLENNRIKQPNK